MNNKPSAAIAPDASGDRALHSSRAHRVAVLAAICMLAAVATTPLLLNQHPSGGDRMPSPDDSAKAAKEFDASGSFAPMALYGLTLFAHRLKAGGYRNSAACAARRRLRILFSRVSGDIPVATGFNRWFGFAPG